MEYLNGVVSFLDRSFLDGFKWGCPPVRSKLSGWAREYVVVARSMSPGFTKNMAFAALRLFG